MLRVIGAIFILCGSVVGFANPLNNFGQGQRISIKVKKKNSKGKILQKKLSVRIAAKNGIHWDYVPGTALSIPFLTIEFKNIPHSRHLSVIIAKVGKLAWNPKKGYTVQMPLLQVSNKYHLNIVDIRGSYEDYEISIDASLKTSAIMVDKNCLDFHLRIKELSRPAGPNLMYVGCRSGTRPHHLSLDILWVGIKKIKYRRKVLKFEKTVLTVPLEHRKSTASELVGLHEGGDRSRYLVEYDPIIPLPYEFWIGMSFFKTSFEQDNFTAPSGAAYQYSQVATAFTGRFWYRPEDTDLSVMARGFGSLFEVSDNFEPAFTEEESVQTYFFSTELLYNVVDSNGWRIDPFFGGWFYFMRVNSRRWGLQRIITPLLGFAVERGLTVRDRLTLTTRFVPLQSFFNPADLDGDQIYMEFEAQYVHELRKGGRWFAQFTYGFLNFKGSAFTALTKGNYLVLGGGYGF